MQSRAAGRLEPTAITLLVKYTILFVRLTTILTRDTKTIKSPQKDLLQRTSYRLIYLDQVPNVIDNKVETAFQERINTGRYRHYFAVCINKQTPLVSKYKEQISISHSAP